MRLYVICDLLPRPVTGSQPAAVLKPVEVQQPECESEQQLLVPEVMSLNRPADLEA